MSDENQNGKWAGEVYDFIRIFKQNGNSVLGLFLLELGWILFLILVTKLSPSGDNQPPAKIIFPGGFEVTILETLIPGMIFITFIWLIWTKRYYPFAFPVWSFFKYLFLFVIGMTLLSISFAINIILFFPALWVERIKIRKFILKQNPEAWDARVDNNFEATVTLITFYKENGKNEKIKRILGNKLTKLILNSNELDQPSKDQLTKRIIKYVEETLALSEIKFSRWFLLKPIFFFLQDQYSLISSQARIGIAQLQSFNYEEDQHSARLNAQIFSSAVDLIRWKLGEIDAGKYIKFFFLPEHILPRNTLDAEKYCAQLQLDVLIWGSYLPGSKNSIWLNASNISNTKHSSKRYMKEIFPENFSVPPLTAVIDQSQISDPFLVLVLSVIVTMSARIQNAKNSGYERLDRIDRLQDSDKIDEIILDLMVDIFMERTCTNVSQIDLLPNIDLYLTDLVGNWVGCKIGDKDIDEKNYKYSFLHRNIFYRVLKECITRNPNCPENYYRAGVMACLLDCETNAIEFFEKAAEYDCPKPSEEVARVIYSNLAGSELVYEISKYDEKANFVLAKYAAHLARAINILGNYQLKDIQEEIQKGKFFINFENLEPDEELASMRVIKHLISDKYPPNMRNINISDFLR